MDAPAHLYPIPHEHPDRAAADGHCRGSYVDARPQNGWDLAGWIDYNRCQALSWLSWSNENTQQIESWFDMANEREPFGTINEFIDAGKQLQGLVNSIDWGETGLPCSRTTPDPVVMMRQAYGILTGAFEFVEGDSIASGSCDLPVKFVVGEAIGTGMCFSVNLLCSFGILQWMQYLFNVCLLILLVFYVQSRWIDKASN